MNMDVAFSTKDTFPAGAESGPQGNCRLCRQATHLMCMRCGDCYCSKRCQDIDWPHHRYICFPKPALVNLNAVATEENTPEIGIVEPVHLKEQLRIMANVCRDLMQQLDNKFICKPSNDNENEKSSQSDHTLNVTKNECITSKKSAKHRNYLQDLQMQHNKSSTISSKKDSPVPIKNDSEKSENQKMYVTGFRSSNRIALCKSEYLDNGAYNHLLDSINNFGQNAPAIKSTPEVNTYVIAFVQKYGTGRFVRAKVLRPPNSKFVNRLRLELVDYGNIVYRSLHELRQISLHLSELPVLVKIFNLSKVGLHTQNQVPFLVNFERQFCKMVLVSGSLSQEFPLIELYDINNGNSINERIENGFQRLKHTNAICKSQQDEMDANVSEINSTANMKANESQISPEPTTTRFTQPPFEEHIFPISTRNAKAVILDTSAVEHGYIACIFQTHMLHLQKVQTYLDQYVKDASEPYQPVPNEYVIAKFDDDWYRGKVLNVSPDGKTFEISYIDFLNEATMTSADIRRYPEDLTVDCYTTLCMIDGLPDEISEELKNFLKSVLQTYEVIHIDRVIEIFDERVALIDCCDLLQLIRNKHLME